MNSLILIGILSGLVISISGAQEADTPKDESSPAVPVPALEQAANEAVSEDDRRIVVVIGPDATPSEDEQTVNIQKAFDSLKARNLLRFSTPEDDPKKVIVILGFRKEDSAESIENLLIDLWQLDIRGLTVSLRTGATIQIETGDGCYAKISNFEDLDRRQIIDLWEFFQKPERKQKFDALFHSGSHAYSKPSVPPPHPASPSTVSLKVERGLARDAIEITRVLEKKGGLVSLGVDEETNAILVDSRDGFLEEARVLLRKWQDYYHPVRISDGKTARAEPASVSSSNTEGASASSKAIVLVIDAEVQQSEVVKQVVEALEKAGVATTRAAETEPFANSSINVTLGIRKDVSHEHVTQLVKALADAGVRSVSFREGLDQGEEQNRIDVRVEPGYSESELAKIYNAVETVQKECGLTLLVATNGLPGKAEKSRPLDANLPKADSFAEVRPVNGQPSPFQPEKSEPPRRVTESKRIVIQPGVDAQESEVAMQFMADLEKAGIAKIDKTEMTPTSDSPIVVLVFMREDESFEKIKQFIVVLRHSGLEHMVLEYGGIHPESRGEPENGLVFRTILGFSPDELQGLEKAARKAAEDCGLSLHFAGTVVAPSEPAASGPPDKKPGVRDAEGYAPGPGSPQPVTQSVLPDSKTIVLVIDADAQKSEVVNDVIAALEKAGIATGKAAETAPPSNSSISVTLNMRKDESYDKIKQLVEALKRAGVQQMSIRAGGVSPEGEDEQNTLILDAQPGHATDELHKIENATRYAAKKCGLSLVVVVRGREGREEGDWSPKPERTQTELPEPVNLLPGSTQAIGLRQAQAQLRNAQLKLAKLRLQFNDQHPSVKALELEIQAMESQLQPREELLDTLQGVRSELVEKNEAARKENGSQNTETARLETLIAELDARIKSVEGALEPASEKVASVKVFALKYAQATDAAEVLKQVYDRGPLKIVPDARTNSVIVTGPEAQVQEIEALLLKLDEAESAANTDTNLPAPVEHIEYKETHPVNRPGETSAPPVSVIPIENEAARLVVQLEDELAQLKLSVGPESPKVKELQARIETIRKSLANTTIQDAPFLSPTDAVQWNLMASEIAKELKKDQEAFSRLHGTNGPRVNYFDEAIEGFQNLHGAWLFDEETEIAEFWEELKTKYQPLIEKGPDALRAERDRLIEKNNSENDEQIVELEILTAWATVQQRYRDRNASLMRGAGAVSLEDVAGVSEGSPRELSQQLAQLRKEYEAANQQAHQLAEQLNRSPDEAKQAELQKAVQRAFSSRQSLLRAELIEMQTRLLKTQRSIDMRERISDQIIKRRVEDLLNPQLNWEGSPQFAPAEDFNTAVSGSSSPPAPIGLGLPEEIDAGAWGEPQNGLRLAIVVKSENSLWNKAQEVQYVVENVSKEKIALRGQRNDQLATLFEVRQTSQAQVQTMPRVNSGVQETGSDIELGRGERAVIARVWMGVVEKQTDAIPDGDPQLLIIDSDAWKFRNKIYVARGCLQPDPDQPTVTIRSGQVAIAFHKPADTSIGSLPASSPAMHVGETRFSDPKESLLAALQGVWDLQSHTNPGDPPDPKIKHLDVEIKGNLMTLWISTDTQRIQAWSAVLKLGEPGPPQQIDITFDPNDGEDRMETFGLIETSDDLVRICLDHSSESQRPEVFAVGARSEIWELRRKPAVSSASELEGDWKLESYALKDGTTQDLSLAYAPQLEIRGNEVFYDSGRNPSKIEINPTQKTLSYQKDSEKAPSLYRYSLGPDQLTLRDAGQSVLVYRRQAAPPSTALATELEGDWHVVAYYDHEGKLQETLPSNRSFRGDQSSFVRPGYRHDCRIKVDPVKKTLWSYSKEEDGSFTQDYYELKGNQLILRNEPGAVGYQVFERGLVRIPSVVPPATQEQKLHWRSAIVEIVASTVGGEAPRDRVIGRGIVISSDGKMLSQLSVSENNDLSAEKITAQFDDGSVIPLKLIEKAGQGWSVLQPEQLISVNHYFELSTTEVHLHDEIRVWGPDHSQAGSESLAPFANTVSAMDRKYPALGIAVWQLRIGHQPVPGTPILDADGHVLGMTITGARDLLLAIPIAELKTMFPKSFGQPSEREPQPVEAIPDWLNNLQGTWIVTDSPIKVDENSGGQMKEIRIDRDQWSIVWTAKPGDPDRVESLRVVRPDEKNLYAIDLVELSTGKVVYPSLYELDQAGLTFCYGYRGERPDEISTGNRGITIRLTRDE